MADLPTDEPILVALSGGADSVMLLRMLAALQPRPPLYAFHFDHALRGAESRADAEFCRALCRELDVPCEVESDPAPTHSGGLEARARRLRYRALSAHAARLNLRTIATAHHSGDRLETLVQRWVRGDELAGLSGPESRLVLAPHSELNPTSRELVLVRPMLALRREPIRQQLRRDGHAWREDSSNQNRAFTRNRIRTEALPAMEASAGPEAIQTLHRFERAVRTLHVAVRERTAHLEWFQSPHAIGENTKTRRLARGPLAELPRPLQRRALWRLLAEATGRGPGRPLLEALVDALAKNDLARHQLPGAWSLHLRRDELVLSAPTSRQPDRSPENGGPRDQVNKLELPGEVRLANGLTICARLEPALADAPLPSSTDKHSRDSEHSAEFNVELDADRLEGELTVRFARPGDRFHALGAPGSRRLCRFLADANVAREERASIPLVFCGTELIWVAGIRPSNARRIRPTTRQRLLLSLESSNPALSPARSGDFPKVPG